MMLSFIITQQPSKIQQKKIKINNFHKTKTLKNKIKKTPLLESHKITHKKSNKKNIQMSTIPKIGLHLKKTKYIEKPLSVKYPRLLKAQILLTTD